MGDFVENLGFLGVWWGMVGDRIFGGRVLISFYLPSMLTLPSILCSACAGGDLNPHASRLTHLKREIYALLSVDDASL